MSERFGVRGVLILLVIISSTCSNAWAASAAALGKSNFHEYLEALENVDANALRTRFYHEKFAIRQGDTVMGVDELLAFETSMKEVADCKFNVQRLVADDDAIAMEAIETFDVRENAALPNIGPVLAGERYAQHLIVFYALTDGRISGIDVKVLSVEKLETTSGN